MADIPASNWTEADASNSTAAPDGWPEGMAPSGVNDSGRAMMGAVKRWYDWTVPLVTGGTSTAYTLAYAVAPGALVDGMSHLVQFNAVNGATATLNVNALGAKPLHFYCGSAWGAWPANMVAVDQVVRVTYNAAAGTYRAIGMPLALTQSVSGVSTIDFTGIPTNVTNLQVIFDLTMGTNNSALQMRYYNSGGSLDAGVNAYYYAAFGVTTGSVQSVTTQTTTFIALGAGINNSASIGIVGDVTIPNIQGVKFTQCNYRSNWFDQGAVTATGVFGYGTRNSNGNITGLRLLASTGTFSGRVTVIMSA